MYRLASTLSRWFYQLKSAYPKKGPAERETEKNSLSEKYERIMCSIPNWVNSLIAAGLRSTESQVIQLMKAQSWEGEVKAPFTGCLSQTAITWGALPGLTCRSGMANNIPNNLRKMHGDGTSRLFFQSNTVCYNRDKNVT